jgi:hypothetical protein
MKSGLIIYVVGKEPTNWDADSEMMTIKQSLHDRRVFASRQSYSHKPSTPSMRVSLYSFRGSIYVR